MKTNKEPIDKVLEDFANKSSSEGLPSNFTHQMMQKIEQEAERKASAKKRLVTPMGWLIFGGFATLITCSLIFGDFSSSETISLPKFDISQHTDKIQLVVATVFAISALVLIDTIYRRKSKKLN